MTLYGLSTYHPLYFQFNEHFFKKLPPGAEASNIMVGEVDHLEQPLMAFIRLKKSAHLGDLTEVPIPTRFLFILLGPHGHKERYHEIGRSIATLMSDEVSCVQGWGRSTLYLSTFVLKYIFKSTQKYLSTFQYFKYMYLECT